MRTIKIHLVSLAVVCLAHGSVSATEPEILRPRVPPDQLAAMRRVTNPLSATAEQVEKGKAVFHGKGFCAACHGRDGRGLGEGLELKGPLPRNFTDPEWQAARADGELFWILKNGRQPRDGDGALHSAGAHGKGSLAGVTVRPITRGAVRC